MKKRILLLSGLLALCIAGQILLRPCLGDRQESAISLAATLEDQKTGDLTDTSDLFTTTDKDPEFTDARGALIKQLFTMIAFVAVIGVGAWFFCKKMACNWTGGKGKNINVTETVSLGPRKLVHIVQIGSKQLLIGSTGDNIRLLADVTDCLQEEPHED
ncbi:MAG: FliO/MopB family protein [Planctomycetota bacterium]|jgi:flagellar biogenesis protein FliO